MPPKDEDAKSLSQHRQQMEQYVDYRNYLTFSMYERVEDEDGNVKKNAVDDMAGRDSGGEGQNRNMWHFWLDLQCFICSRQTAIPR